MQEGKSGAALPRASPWLPQAAGHFDIRPTLFGSAGQGQATPFCLGPTSLHDPGHCRRGMGRKTWETNRKPMLWFELSGLFLLRKAGRALP